MEVLSLHNESLSWTLAPGEVRHVVLLSPENVSLQVHQAEDSRFSLHIVSLSDASSAIDVTVYQDAPRCYTALYGLSLARGEQQIDLSTHVVHAVGGGYSEQLIKNVLADSARVSFYGELKVLADAQKTEAYQTNRNVLLSPDARIATRPQLEIYADDVKCSHGATTGQLDEQALFYMRQRGVSLSDARRMLLEAFLEEVLLTLPDEALREQIVETLVARL